MVGRGPFVAMTGEFGNLRFTPYNGKIADITEADVNKHTVDISAYVPANCVLVIVGALRISGTGFFNAYPNEGVQEVRITEAGYAMGKPIAISNQRLQYSLTVANDDFDLYLFGYFTEG